MLLDTTTRTITVKSNAAATTTELDILVDYVDESRDYWEEHSSNAATSGTARVTIVGAPDTDWQRRVKLINVFNRDTVPHTLTFEYDDAGTYRTIDTITIEAGKALRYKSDDWSITNPEGIPLSVSYVAGLSEDTAPDPAADYAISSSASGSALRKVKLGRFSNFAKSLSVTGSRVITAGDLFRTLRVDASGGAATETLPATATTDDWIIIRKSDSGANRVTVKDNAGNDIAWLSAQYDEACFAWWAGAWVPVFREIAPLDEIYNTVGTFTWTKAPLARTVYGKAFGPGGGAASGARQASGTIASGGGGGAPGAIVEGWFPASALGATETVTIPDGGAGGAAITVDSTAGANGTAGTNTSFGSHLVAEGGNPGAGASTTAATGGGAKTALSTIAAMSNGGAASITGAATQPTRGFVAGGAAGGSINAANTVLAAAAGGDGSANLGTGRLAGGAAGATGGNGSAGTNAPNTNDYYGGSAAGGGGASTGGVGGDGGTPGAPGAGGSGGGASRNGNNSGAGSKGARGELRLRTYFK